ncbi:MAG: hypothetical protein RIB60_00590 [Phycisphaerales bacterium]
MPTQPTDRRVLVSRAAALAVIAGTVLSGCETTESSDEARYRPYQGTPTPSEQTQTDVNSGLASLSAKTAPPSLIEGEPPEPEDDAQASQIAQAAQLLDEYFARASRRDTSVADAGSTGYDPSAELGPTGSSRYATNPTPAEPVTLAEADETPADSTNSGLSAFRDDDPAIDSVLAAIDAANRPTPAVDRPATIQPETPAAPATTIADVGDAGSDGLPTGSGEAATQSNQSKPVIIVEDAPRAPVTSRPAATPATRVVDSSAASGGPAAMASPEATEGSDSAIDAAIAAELADDPVLSAVAADTPPASTANDRGTLQGRPVERSTPIASADGSLPRSSVQTPEQRKNELVDELVAVLGEIAETSDEPYRMGLALAGLETLSPGALYELTESGVLMPDEVRTLLAAHEFLSGLSAGGGLPDPGSVSDLLGNVKERLDEHAPLKITAAELCTRVMGYGQYDMFPKAADGSYQFVAGRRQPIILYVEVDRFGRRPKVGTDGLARWEVSLSQTLEIFHDADDLLVMARDAETDTSLSRNKIRDYYLINQTYLPENLSIGRYNLKVTMRDENKQAVATAIVPVTIVPSAPGFGG